jgi:superfamily II DNA or RNA helicase
MMGSLAWHGMGLGKTLSSLWLARKHKIDLKSKGITGTKFMVILPKSAISTWKVECYNNAPDIYDDMVIYPYSQLHSAIRRLKYIDVRLLIFDEVHYLKSPETDRIKTLAAFFRELHNSPTKFQFGRIIAGTGTPAPNSAAEYFTAWAMCTSPNLDEAANRMLDKTRFENWRSTFANKTQMNWKTGKKKPPAQQGTGHAIKWEGVNNADKLVQLLNEFVHFRRVEDCIDLPTKQIINIDLGLEDDKLLENANIEEPEAYMALVERLARAKAPHAIDWVKEYLHTNREQLVVFAMNRHPIEQMREMFPRDVRLITGAETNNERAQNLKDFQEGKYRILAMTYAAGSESLNLQNCKVALYLGYSWTDAKLKQAMARIWRSGQLHHTFHYFLVSGENDAKMLDKVLAKEEATTLIENLLLSTNKVELDVLI